MRNHLTLAYFAYLMSFNPTLIRRIADSFIAYISVAVMAQCDLQKVGFQSLSKAPPTLEFLCI